MVRPIYYSIPLKIFIFCYIVLETFLYLVFLIIDFSSPEYYQMSSYLKITGIFLCFLLLSVTLLLSSSSITLRCTCFILLLTLLADLLLLFTAHYLPGILLFCLIQAGYNKQLNGSGSRIFPVLILTAGIILLLMKILPFTIDITACAAVFYFLFLLYNNMIAQRNINHHSCHQEKLFAAGLFLLLLCDIMVGLFHLTDYFPMNTMPILYQTLYPFVSNAMWLFYLPSQVFITMSAVESLPPSGRRNVW